MKKFRIDVYNKDGLIIQSVNMDKLLNKIAFRSELYGGQGNMVLDFLMPWDDPEPWTDPYNFCRVLVIDKENPRGRLLYSGFIFEREPITNRDTQAIRVNFYGLGSLLTNSLYKNGSDFSITQTDKDPSVIIKEIIDHFNTVVSPSSGVNWIGYDAVAGIRAGNQIDTYGTDITYKYEKSSWLAAIKDTYELMEQTWYWYVDQGGDFILKDKPSEPTHILTINSDIDEVEAPEVTDEIANSVTLSYDGGETAAQEDAESIAKYDKREIYVTDSDIVDEDTALEKAQSILADRKNSKIKAEIVVNDTYDIESIKVGDTVRILNYKKDSVILNDNMLITSVQYDQYTATLELEGKRYDMAKEIKLIANS